MKRTILYKVITVCVVLFRAELIWATSIIIRQPEDVFNGAPLIIDAYVQNVTFKPINNSYTGYAEISLTINEALKGSCPSSITIRRYGISDQNNYLYTSYTPDFKTGDDIIVAIRKYGGEYYMPLGLYNGTFYIKDGLIKNTTISLDEFKLWIAELLAGDRNFLPPEIPRFDAKILFETNRSVLAKSRVTVPTIFKALDSGSHLDGEFNALNSTWDLSYHPVKFYYNPTSAPASIATALARINDAFDIWNEVTHSFFKLESISTSDLTTEGQINNTKSVIYWQEWTEGVFYQEFPYPEDPSGYGTNKGSDILFNTLYSNNFYFDSSPPQSRELENIDFTDCVRELNGCFCHRP